MENEVNILGGGISGLGCAIILRKNEYNVNVFEKQNDPGKRFHNDWQGLENWSEKVDFLKQIESYGIDLSFDYEPVSELTIHCSNKAKTITGKNACYLVRRGSSTGCLDTSLHKQAEELGVNIHMGSVPGEGVPVQVNATGPRNANIFARGIKFDTDIEKSYHMAFGDDIARGFYSYLLIKNGHGTIATVFGRKNVHHADEFLRETVKYFTGYVDERAVSSGKKFGGYGHFEIKNNLYDENGAMLIGEAGGFQDYFWGFGMRYAFQSANFAARSIMGEGVYEDLIKENLTGKMEHSKRNRFLFEMLGPLAYPFAYHLFAASKNPLRLLNMVYR
ncbi:MULTISPECIES: NAD(P)/FAD-dependent oxidoreductase [unclassified Methanosarcina]|uniref:NAD(P)/FAD-dependent oxidoreductase n=1 Tax=unclassified Methanosarcina TaxID=2644672 RepID=UPI000615E482|nr:MULTISPECIES: NAD(P)/FAD-dependent oxidoreductase [unclassified Methanosarcina]AKB19250.1 hypothetical protein MSWHS_2387 [Methanosarcina sp. WWM596]AKB22920.1 hypothetical protein MSWH1_2649 [Methanosarcina sp. WH1]